MRQKILSVIDDIKVHHQFDEEAQVEYKMEGDHIKVWVNDGNERIELVNIELPACK